MLILSFAFIREIRNIYITCGTKQCIRYIDVTKRAASLGAASCTAPLGIHALTGCDSVSAFGGRGKVAAMKLISSNDDTCQAKSSLGEQ